METNSLVWTKEKPTIATGPGKYWMRHVGGGVEPGQAYIVTVCGNRLVNRIEQHAASMGLRVEWAGPISEPREAEAALAKAPSIRCFEGRTYTAHDGLLWERGRAVPAREADEVARAFGYYCAEQLVRQMESEAV